MSSTNPLDMVFDAVAAYPKAVWIPTQEIEHHCRLQPGLTTKMLNEWVLLGVFEWNAGRVRLRTEVQDVMGGSSCWPSSAASERPVQAPRSSVPAREELLVGAAESI